MSSSGGSRSYIQQCHVDMSPSCSMSSLARNQLEQVQMIVTNSGQHDVDKVEYQKPAYVAVALIMAITLFAVFFPMVIGSDLLGMQDMVYEQVPTQPPCTNQCRLSVVESIPDNLTYPAGSPSHPSTYSAWKQLIQSARTSIDMGSFYWTLQGKDVKFEDPSAWQGESILSELKTAARERNIKIRIAQSQPDQPSYDIMELAKIAGVEVRNLNFTRWFGSGVLHTKLWLVDDQHFYVGSANMDWRSLTQVKEMGIVAFNCSCLVADLVKIFTVYWYMGQPGATVPKHWPSKLSTQINKDNPLSFTFNNTPANIYFSSSPPPFSPEGRTDDIDAILDVISKAERYIYIAVMDYFPTTLYTKPRIFWPVIDDALRRASLERGVEVRLMASWWNHSRPDLPNYLQSLHALSGAIKANIQVRLFHVPAFTEAQKKIPFARVNHNKYMVTDNAAYIGTSNWSGDYFISTGGIGVIVNQTQSANSSQPLSSSSNLQQQLTAVFDRDWNSSYAWKVKDRPKAHRVRYNIHMPDMGGF